jgi:hypothetical protein
VSALDGCREKVNRAREHGEALEREIAFWQEANPVPFEAKYEAESGYHVSRITALPEVPVLRWGILIGDVLHNLRSALDHLAWALSNWGGRTPSDPEGVKFPIVDSPERFLSGVAARATSQMDPAHVARIETMQPYHGQGGMGPDSWTGPWIHPLAFVRNLNNDDKHRVVTALPVVSNRYEMWSSPPIPFDEHRVVDFGGEELHVGAVIMRTDVSADYREVQMYGRMTPGVLLPDRRGIDHLERSAVFVERVISELEVLM